MMGVKSLEVYNTVHNITPINNKLGNLLTEQQLKELGIDTGLVMNVAYLYKISDDEFVEKSNKFIFNSYSKNLLEMILID